LPESPLKLPFAKPACWATLVFLALVTVLLAFDESQRVALYAIPIWGVLLVGGYYLSTYRKRSSSALPTVDDRQAAPTTVQP
jgi:amino acid transporter, AAT family